MENFQLAQINVARMKGVSIDDPVMKEFVDNLDKINSLAESSNGFVWRLKDESNNATHLNPYSDEQVIINISVWETIEDLENFVYRSFHTDFLRRRKNGFTYMAKLTQLCGGYWPGNSPRYWKQLKSWIFFRETEHLKMCLILKINFNSRRLV